MHLLAPLISLVLNNLSLKQFLAPDTHLLQVIFDDIVAINIVKEAIYKHGKHSKVFPRAHKLLKHVVKSDPLDFFKSVLMQVVQNEITMHGIHVTVCIRQITMILDPPKNDLIFFQIDYMQLSALYFYLNGILVCKLLADFCNYFLFNALPANQIIG